MSNAYCTIDQFKTFFDARSLGMLSNDESQRTIVTNTLQTHLDMAASELESHLSARITLPLATVPLILTKWVAVKATESLYSRRADKPKGLSDDVKKMDDWLQRWDDGAVSIGVERDVPALDLTGRAYHLNKRLK